MMSGTGDRQFLGESAARLAAVGAALLLWALFAIYSASPALAAQITVNTTADENNSDGDCSLREAISSRPTPTRR